MTTQLITENVSFTHEGLTLSGRLTYPSEGQPHQALLLCSPHPNFAGDMRNNVIAALAEDLGHRAVVLRFDYAGVGESQICLPPGQSVFDYWQQVEDTRDYSAATNEVGAAFRFLARSARDLPISIIGYSFGAATGLRWGMEEDQVGRLVGIAPPLARVDFSFLKSCRKPCLLLCGDHDFVCAAEDLNALVHASSSSVCARVLPDEDHFFRGHEATLASHVARFLEGTIQ